MQKIMSTLCLGVLALTGCSSQTRQVSASLPLVQEQKISIGQLVPTQFSKELENPDARQISHPKYQVVLGAFYMSSLGQDCRKLLITPPNQRQVTRVVCAEHQINPNLSRTWYLIPNIVQSSTTIQL